MLEISITPITIPRIYAKVCFGLTKKCSEA